MLDISFLGSPGSANTLTVIAAEAAFLLSVMLVLAFKRLALHHGVLLDKPCDQRKFHQGAIPVVGGLAIFMAVGLSTMVAMPAPTVEVLFGASAGLLVLGSLDDSLDISAKTKLLWQLSIITTAILVTGAPLPELWVGSAAHPALYGLALILVVTGMAGYLNAINMVDGADGLAGGVMLVTAVYLSIACTYVGDSALADLLLVLSGGLLGFLLFNFRRPSLQRAKVFMGDAGTLSLGFLLAWCATALAVKNLPAVLWLMAYPVLDLASVALRRMKAGKSPFHADRSHLHHLLLDSGMSHARMVSVVLGFNAALGLIGVLGVFEKVPSWVLLAGFPLLVAGYLGLTKQMSK